MAIICKSGIICYTIKDMLAQYFSKKLKPSMHRLLIDMAEIKIWKQSKNIIIYHLFFLQFFCF